MPAITVDNDESDYSECLYPGAKFKGEQKSKTQRYQVDVQIDYVNWEQSYICGVLNIIGLTDHDPQIKTFFNGEIIGPEFSFLTRKWEADYKRDLEHWRYVYILNDITHIQLQQVQAVRKVQAYFQQWRLWSFVPARFACCLHALEGTIHAAESSR